MAIRSTPCPNYQAQSTYLKKKRLKLGEEAETCLSKGCIQVSINSVLSSLPHTSHIHPHPDGAGDGGGVVLVLVLVVMVIVMVLVVVMSLTAHVQGLLHTKLVSNFLVNYNSQMRQLRHKEVTSLAQGHITSNVCQCLANSRHQSRE